MRDKEFLSSSSSMFERVFKEVDCSESLNLKNPSELRIFRFQQIKDCRFVTRSLFDCLTDDIGSYVLSRAKIEKLELEGRSRNIGLEAIRAMKQNGDPNQEGSGNELGEILIYSFLEHVLNAPKIFSKAELLKTESKSDGIHLVFPNGETRLCYQLLFGSSSIIGDFGDAIDKAFCKIATISKNESEEIGLIENTVFEKDFTKEQCEFLERILVPSSGATESYDTSYGVFLGYSLGLSSETRTNDEYRSLIEAKMDRDIKHYAGKIRTKIEECGLSGHSFYVYVLPFDDAETDKLSLVEKLME